MPAAFHNTSPPSRAPGVPASAPREARLGTSLVNNNALPSPMFFVSVDSKEFRFSVSRLESILRGGCASVDSKELVAPNCEKCDAFRKC